MTWASIHIQQCNTYEVSFDAATPKCCKLIYIFIYTYNVDIFCIVVNMLFRYAPPSTSNAVRAACGGKVSPPACNASRIYLIRWTIAYVPYLHVLLIYVGLLLRYIPHSLANVLRSNEMVRRCDPGLLPLPLMFGCVFVACELCASCAIMWKRDLSAQTQLNVINSIHGHACICVHMVTVVVAIYFPALASFWQLCCYFLSQ